MKKTIRIALLTMLVLSISLTTNVFGQAITGNSGSIAGTITDTSGAGISGASIDITSPETGFKTTTVTTGSGFYQVGPLNPGRYVVTVVANGFVRLQVSTVVRTGSSTTGSFQMNVGSTSDTVEVSTGDLQVNTTQSAVQDVLTQDQISRLPVNGRNFLDTLSIEPGVQLQNGEDFDPTKAGYSAVSINGVAGRTTRLMLDGQDITDEFVGTTMYYIPQGAVDEAQLNRSNQDVSGEVTSTGAVQVASRAGTNDVHGQLFYNFQDARAGFATNGGTSNDLAPWQRNQYGGSIGLPFLKDKLFAFADVERTLQHSSTAAQLSGFDAIQKEYPAYATPYKETFSIGRLDWNGPMGGHYFARGMYDNNSIAGNANDGYAIYANRDNTYGLAFGADFAKGHWSHSFRGSYEKFHNMITDQTAGNSSVYNGIPGLYFYYLNANLFSGPNVNAPQATFQSDKQISYQGTWTAGSHTLRFGASMNRLLAGGFAAFYNSTRTRIAAATLLSNCGNVAGAGSCADDPINGYAPNQILFGNGQGYATERTEFNQLGGNTSWRYAFFVQDSWKMTPDFTWNIGIRYSVDTNRANQDLQQPTCADINNTYVETPAGCTSGDVKLFDLWRPGLGHPIEQPFGNVAPQLGFAYSPGNHKTSLRGSFGLFVESNIFNNQSNSRSNLLKSGNFFNYNILSPTATNFKMPDGTTLTSWNGVTLSSLFSNSLANDAPTILSLLSAYQAASATPQANPSYIGSTLSADGMYAPFYRQPYSMQWSFGVEHELSKGSIVSANYIHNTTLHISQRIDVNRDGAADTYNLTAAQNAVAATNDSYGCGASSSQSATSCAIAAGATIGDYSGNGLDSTGNVFGSYAPSYFGATPATGAAFPGMHADLGPAGMIFPAARSGFDALQLVYRGQKSDPVRGIKHANFQVAYQYGRSVTSSANGSDQFFVTTAKAWNNDAPTQYIGPTDLDHRHQLNFGGSFQVSYGPQIGILAHFYSAAATSLTLSTQSGTATLFQSDLNGDGTAGDLAPGTDPGAYMRQIKGKDLAAYTQKFNAEYAGKFTPAGQAVVNSGLFSAAQLHALGGDIQALQVAPEKALQNPVLRTFDANASYPISLGRLRRGMSLEPGVQMYNVFNFSNFNNLNSTVLGNEGEAAVGYVNGPNVQTGLNRYTRSSAFSQGSPRLTEFQLKLNF